MSCRPVSSDASPHWPTFACVHVFLAVVVLVVVVGIELSISWEEEILKLLESFHDSIYCFA